MSGAIGVALAAATEFVSSDKGRWLLYAASFVALFLAFYRAWTTERKCSVALFEELSRLKDARAELQFIFDENDPRCVRDNPHKSGAENLKSRVWYIGIRNGSRTKSADHITVRAKESWFVSRSIAVAHWRWDEQGFPHEDKEPILLKKETLEPGAEEFVELFGMDGNTQSMPEDVFHKMHEFIIEARARDTKIAKIVLRYEPTTPAKITKVSDE